MEAKSENCSNELLIAQSTRMGIRWCPTLRIKLCVVASTPGCQTKEGAAKETGKLIVIRQNGGWERSRDGGGKRGSHQGAY